jgi:uncharacterized membrane protein
MKIILLIPYLILAVALIVISIPLIQRRIRPNVWYGFRVRRTLEDPKVWYAANRYSAFHLLAIGVILLVVAPACYFSPGISFISDALICVGVTFAGLAFGLIRSFRYLRQID